MNPVSQNVTLCGNQALVTVVIGREETEWKKVAGRGSGQGLREMPTQGLGSQDHQKLTEALRDSTVQRHTAGREKE